MNMNPQHQEPKEAPQQEKCCVSCDLGSPCANENCLCHDGKHQPKPPQQTDWQEELDIFYEKHFGKTIAYPPLKSFVTALLERERGKTAHKEEACETAEGCCCACDYDIAGFESKEKQALQAQKQKMVDMVEGAKDNRQIIDLRIGKTEQEIYNQALSDLKAKIKEN